MNNEWYNAYLNIAGNVKDGYGITAFGESTASFSEMRYWKHKGDKQGIGKDSLSLETGYESDKPNRQIIANRSQKKRMGGMKRNQRAQRINKDYGLGG